MFRSRGNQLLDGVANGDGAALLLDLVVAGLPFGLLRTGIVISGAERNRSVWCEVHIVAETMQSAASAKENISINSIVWLSYPDWASLSIQLPPCKLMGVERDSPR